MTSLIDNWKVLFYVPNIVDYFRFWFLYKAVESYVYEDDVWTFAMLYILSYSLDIIDGPLARNLNQTSKLGIYLDMVADRVSSCLLLYLSSHAINKRYLQEPITWNLQTIFYASIFCCFSFCLVFVEIISHGVVMIQSEIKHVHQKQLSLEKSKIVSLYLSNKTILFSTCAAFEFSGLIILLDLPIIYFMLFFPLFLFRALANLIRLYKAISGLFSKPQSKTA